MFFARTKKYVASVVLLSMLSQTISSSGFIAFAQDELISKDVVLSEGTGDFDTLSVKVQSQMMAQAKSLQSSPRLSEYIAADVVLDTTSQSVTSIKDLQKPVQENIPTEVKETLSDFSKLYGVVPSSNDTFRVTQSRISPVDGSTHTRLKRYYKNLEVIGGDMVAHLESANTLTRLDGEFTKIDLDISPRITQIEAQKFVGKKYHLLKQAPTLVQSNGLVIYMNDVQPTLAWSFNMMGKIEGKIQPIRVYIDASRNSVLAEIPLHSGAAGVTLTGETTIESGGGMRSFSGILVDGRYTMEHPTLGFKILNASVDSVLYPDAGTGAYRLSPNWGTTDREAVAAMEGMTQSVSFFEKYGIDFRNLANSPPLLSGQAFPAYIHDESSVDNAYFAGDSIVFGPWMVSLDIIGHELGHGVTQGSSNLIYLRESGALNESFSDIFGTAIELLYQDSTTGTGVVAGKSDWLIGEDIALFGSQGLRDMCDPLKLESPSRYRGKYWVNSLYDWEGVHYNSGVQNKFFCLLTRGGIGENDGLLYSLAGIGLNDAVNLAMETNLSYIRSDANYSDARSAWIAAAESIAPTLVPQIKATWDAVGVDEVLATVPVMGMFEVFNNSISGSALPSGFTTFWGQSIRLSDWFSESLSTSGNVIPGWQIDTSTGSLNSASGSIVSGRIANSEASVLVLTGTTHPGKLSFDYRVSSEYAYDSLRFYIDDVFQSQWSGEIGWKNTSFYVGNEGSWAISETSLPKKLSWVYRKDISDTMGLDRAWLDSIRYSTSDLRVDTVSSSGTGGYYLGVSPGLHLVRSDSNGSTTVRINGQGTTSTSTGADMTMSLDFLPDGPHSIEAQSRNSEGVPSPLIRRSVVLDRVAPTSGMLMLSGQALPSAGRMYSRSSTPSFNWTMSSDVTTRITGYSLEASRTADFAILAHQTGYWESSTSGELFPVGSNSEWLWYVRLRSYDAALNVSVSNILELEIDTITPTLTGLRADRTVIRSSSENTVTLTASSGSLEPGSVVESGVYQEGTILGFNSEVPVDGSMSLPIDLTSFKNGGIALRIKATDKAWNISPELTIYISKAIMVNGGVADFISGSATILTEPSVLLSTVQDAEYSISGTGTAQGSTGSIVAWEVLQVPILLDSAVDGYKYIQVLYTYTGGVTETVKNSIILDRTAPVISGIRPVNGSILQGERQTIFATIEDLSLVSMEAPNGYVPVSKEISFEISLVPGLQTINRQFQDALWNVRDMVIDLYRTVAFSREQLSVSGNATIVAKFDTDIPGLVHSLYLEDMTTGSGGYSIPATSTLSSTEYLTEIAGLPTWHEYRISPTHTTPGLVTFTGASQIIRVPTRIEQTLSGSITATGTLQFGLNSSGSLTIAASTGSIILYSSTGGHSITLPNSGLTLSGGSTWNGIFNSIESNTTPLIIQEVGFTQTGGIYQAGSVNNSIALSASWTLQINIGNQYNGKVLRVYRSEDGISSVAIDRCTVIAGVCQFQTNHFSLFAFTVATDSTPDAFTFPSKSLSTLPIEVFSDLVVISGINTDAPVSIVGGSYSVNGGVYTASGGTLQNGQTLQVKISGPFVSGVPRTASVSVGWVVVSFQVLYTETPVVTTSSSGGGGGGGGGNGGGVTPSIFASTTSTPSSNGNASVVPAPLSTVSPGNISTRPSAPNAAPEALTQNRTSPVNVDSQTPSSETSVARIQGSEGINTQEVLANSPVSYVVAHALNVRSAPSAYSRKISVLSAGDSLYRTGVTDSNGWVSVTLADGKNGFVPSRYIRVANENDLFREQMDYQTALALWVYERRRWVKTHALNVRKSPNAWARAVQILREGEDVIVISTQSGWSEVFTAEAHGFVRTKYLQE